MDLSESILPKSDQINADDLLAGPRTVTIRDVKAGNSEQPVNIITDEFGPRRPYKPSKSMRRVLVTAWKSDSAAYVGRRMVLFRNPAIKFGGDEVGGIQISHLSGIDRPLTFALTVSKGKRAPFTVKPIADAPPEEPPQDRAHKAVAAFEALGIHQAQLEARVRSHVSEWTAQDIASLLDDYQAVKRGDLAAADFAAPQADPATGEVIEDTDDPVYGEVQ